MVDFDTFINELSNHASDWQVMVVTDDDGCSTFWNLTPNTLITKTYLQLVSVMVVMEEILA